MASELIDVNETNGGALTVTATIFLIITYFSVILRAYVRALLTHGFQGDDWFMLVAQVNFTLSCAFILVGVNTGLGHHNKALPQIEEIEALKWQALATATYVSNMMFIKFSIGIFLLRLATQKIYCYIIWGSLGIVGIMSVVLFFWNLLQCSPVEAQWDYTISNHTCVSSKQIVSAAYALSIMTIVTDWLYALLPIPMIWKVKMSTQAKLTVSVVLGLGIFASIATLIRLKFLADLNEVDDILFAGTDAMVWTLVEPGVAISAASLVTIRPLLRAWKLKGFESTDRYGSRRYRVQFSGTGSGPIGSKSCQSRGMPGFGNNDIMTGDVELGVKSFSSTATTVISGGGPASEPQRGNRVHTIPPPPQTTKLLDDTRSQSNILKETIGAKPRLLDPHKKVTAGSGTAENSHLPFENAKSLVSYPTVSVAGFTPPTMPPPAVALPTPPVGITTSPRIPEDPDRNITTNKIYNMTGEGIWPVVQSRPN